MFVSFSFFFVTTSMNAVNRAVLYIPIELIQKNVNILDVNDESDLYFNKSDLKTDLDKYFQNSLEKYVISYEVTYTFTNQEGSMVCISTKCQGVKISVNANICFDAHYEKSMFYSIGES